MSAVARERGVADAVAESALARIATFGAMIVLAIGMQSTLLPQLTLHGIIPQLGLVVVVTLAYLEGERVGTAVGFFAGLLQDLLLPESILGLTALIYTVVGFSVGYVREHLPTASVWTPVVASAVATAGAETGYATMAILLGQRWVGAEFTAKAVGFVVLYNTLVTPLVFPLLAKVAARVRPERVRR